MTFLLDLRNTLKTLHDPRLREELRHAADNLDQRLIELSHHATEDTMRNANSAWAYAHRILKQVKNDTEPPTGGSLDGVLLQMAA